MIFGCTRHSSNKFGSALICTKIRSGRMLQKSLQPLKIFLDKVFTLKNSNKLNSVTCYIKHRPSNFSISRFNS